MADLGFGYGMGAGSAITIVGGPTGLVVEDIKIRAGGSELKIQNNNAGQTVGQSIVTSIEGEFTGGMEFTGWADPSALIGKEGTGVASSSNTTAVSTGTIYFTVLDCESDHSRGNWTFQVHGRTHAAVV
jgi:hypothetical protein